MGAPANIPKPAYAGSAAVKRLIAAGRKAGLDVGGFEALPDGTVRILEARAMPQQPEDLFNQLERDNRL